MGVDGSPLGTVYELFTARHRIGEHAVSIQPLSIIRLSATQEGTGFRTATRIVQRLPRASASYTAGVLRYAITDSASLSKDYEVRSAALMAEAQRWADDGVDYVQLREKDLSAGRLLQVARSLARVFRDRGVATRLLVSGRSDVALAAGVDGVHLTSSPGELSPDQVRQIFAGSSAKRPAVSVSCHTLDDVTRAVKHASDLILFGPVFEKRVGGSLVTAGCGLEQLRAACSVAAGVPVFALGGVTGENAAHCEGAGAAGVAGIRLFQFPRSTMPCIRDFSS